LAAEGSRADATLRAEIEGKLRGTTPGGDPLAGMLRGLAAEHHEMARQHLPAQLVPAAVMVPLVERPSGLTVLLTLRASHLKNHAGQISFPGGRIEARDVGPWEAALREAEEEIGLARRYASLVGYLPDMMIVSGFRITPVVAFVQPGFELRLDRTEVEDAFEVPLEFLLDPSNHLPRERHFRGMTFKSWDIPWQDRQIWGATAHMLVALYRLLRES
jgi:8-oxo-dGTP pyrophosphatase MutT (NUDIX family)